MADNLKEMLERARAAQKVIEFWPQEKVDEMVLAVGWESYKRDTAEILQFSRTLADKQHWSWNRCAAANHNMRTRTGQTTFCTRPASLLELTPCL